MDAGELIAPGERRELAAVIEDVVRATPGVRNLYRSGSLISHLLRAGAAALGARPEEEPLVSIAPSDGGIAVEVSLGVDAAERSGDVVRAVHGAVAAMLEARGVRGTSIALTVVHVPSRVTA